MPNLLNLDMTTP